jgi:DNA-binding SARP family transcriptional activator/WD40 repeat protein
MDVRVLGPLEVVVDGTSVPLGGAKQRTVLALLAASPGRTVAASALILGVYGDEAPPTALRTIHTYVSNLRHEVGDLIVRSGDGYRMVLDASTTLDASQFEDLYSRGSALVDEDCLAATSLLRDALSLWRGHVFADVEAHAGIEAEVTRLTEMRVSALESRVEADLARGAHRDIIGELEALCEEHPLRETLREKHMIALYRSGRQAEALRAYSRTRAQLGEELGIEPSVRLQGLEEMILTQDPALDLPPPSTVERLAVLAAEIGDVWSDEPMHLRDGFSARRDEVLARGAVAAGGAMVDVRGNAALAVFPTVGQALSASRELSAMRLQVALDHGEVEVSDERISGPPVSRSLRLAAIANPGQVLVSSEAQAALAASGDKGWAVSSLGAHEVSGLGSVQLFQLTGEGMAADFGALRVDRLPPPLGDRSTGSLPGYELRDEIGFNEFSTTYRAYQASVGREVAVRVFESELVSEPRFIRRFETVAQRIARVEHPHLVPMLDYWRDPARAVLVHRLVSGGTLRARWKSSGIERADLMPIVQKIGSALAVCHAHGLVHGQVTADNVLLDEAGNPYLADLGVATVVEGLVPGGAEAPLTPSTDVEALRSLLCEGAPGHRVPPPSESDNLEVFLGGLQGVEMPPPPTRVRNPYKGLAAYDSGDERDFYGRDEVVGRVVETIAGKSLTMVVGPSGIGKSSIVKAGLVPQLRIGAIPGSESWLFVDMYPGAHPFDRLETAMERVAVRSPGRLLERMREGGLSMTDAARGFLPERVTLLLVIDQFEELFTQTADEVERRRFLEVLTDLGGEPEAPVKVVATVRADFFDRPLKYADFGGVIADSVVTVAAPSREDLVAIVTRPAKGVGVAMEEALVDVLVDEADEEIGGLPLLQLALTEIFETRRSDLLTLDDYRSVGGLAATVGATAESVFRSLDRTEQLVAREVFLSLVSVTDEASDTRRRVRVTDLEDGPKNHDSVERVLSAFGRARLLVFDRDPITRGPTVEMAHEALIARWDRYGDWIDEVRDDLLARRRVEMATRDWLESGEEADYLLTGSRLEGAESWQMRSGVRMGVDETRFLAESRDAFDDDQLRTNKRRRRVLTGLSVALAVAALLGIVAWVQRGIANRIAVETRVERLAAQAHLALEHDPDLAVNLAVQAYEEAQMLGDDTPGEVMTALQSTLQASRHVATLPEAGGFGLPASWSPDGSTIAIPSSTNEDEVVVYRTDGFTEMARFDAGGTVLQVNFTPDGESIAVSYYMGEYAEGSDSRPTIPLIALFEVGTWTRTGEYVGQCCSEIFGFSPDGRYVAADGWWRTGSDYTAVWEVETPSQPSFTYDGAWFQSWARDSSAFLAYEPGPDTIHVVDPRSGEAQEKLSLSGFPSTVDVNPATGDVVVVVFDQALTQVMSSTGEVIDEYSDAIPTGARFSHDGRRMFRWGNRDDVLVTDLENGRTTQLHGHDRGVTAVTESPNGHFLAVVTHALETEIWDVTAAGPAELGNLYIGGHVESAVPSAEGTIWQAIQLSPETGGRGVRLSLDGSFETQVSDEFQYGFQKNPVISPTGVVAGGDVNGATRVQSLVSGELLLARPEEPCGYPISIDDLGEKIVIGGANGGCNPGPGGGVLDLATGEMLFEIPLPVYAAFGHPGTPTEDLVAIQSDFETIEIRRLPFGDLVASVRTPGSYRPFISADGGWLTWGSEEGTHLVDLVAVAAGTPIEDAVVRNLKIEGDSPNVTRASADLLAASFSRGVIRVWRIEDGELWFTLPESDHVGITYLLFSPDGRYLYYADGGVLIRMPLDPEELAALARERSQRDFTIEECEQFLSEFTDCTVYQQ